MNDDSPSPQQLSSRKTVTPLDVFLSGVRGSFRSLCSFLPIGSMYGIFTYIYHKNQPHVGKYTIPGSYGLG